MRQIIGRQRCARDSSGCTRIIRTLWPQWHRRRMARRGGVAARANPILSDAPRNVCGDHRHDRLRGDHAPIIGAYFARRAARCAWRGRSIAASSSAATVRLWCARRIAEFRGAYLLACAGVMADRIARHATIWPVDFRIVPFRGEYFRLRDT